MDESKYLELREAVRDCAERESASLELTRRLVSDIERDINRLAAREQKVCFVGVSRLGEFVKDEFDVQGSELHFAIQILFHDGKQNVLFKPVIPFSAKWRRDSIEILCETTGVRTGIGRAGVGSDEGRRPVIDLLEKALEKEVAEIVNRSS